MMLELVISFLFFSIYLGGQEVIACQECNVCYEHLIERNISAHENILFEEIFDANQCLDMYVGVICTTLPIKLA